MISLRGALLVARYVKRALHEAERTPRGVYVAMQRQIEVVTLTLAMMKTLERCCCCAESAVPLVYWQCEPCKVLRMLWNVASHPSHHSTFDQHRVLEACTVTLRAGGFMS